MGDDKSADKVLHNILLGGLPFKLALDNNSTCFYFDKK